MLRWRSPFSRPSKVLTAEFCVCVCLLPGTPIPSQLSGFGQNCSSSRKPCRLSPRSAQMWLLAAPKQIVVLKAAWDQPRFKLVFIYCLSSLLSRTLTPDATQWQCYRPSKIKLTPGCILYVWPKALTHIKDGRYVRVKPIEGKQEVHRGWG